MRRFPSSTRRFPGAQAARSAGVTAGGAASSAGATVAVDDDTTAAVRVDLTGATARRGALRRAAARGAVAARGGARRRTVRLRAARCAAAARLGLRAGFAGAAAALRLAPRLAGAPFFFFAAPEPSFWARRARFQTLRAAAECLRARLASRLASFRRLRARFNSSFAMRTRCLATSACSRARSRGSAGVSCSLPVFFIGGLATRKERSLTQARGGCHRGELIHRICA